jgi:HAD superfamily phosphoserine phosphatase-like hydrolase
MDENRMEGRRLALFDMDGTLLAWDTQVLFAGYVCRRFPWRRLLFLPFFCCLPLAALRLWGDGRMKRIFLGYLWRMPRTKLEELAMSFADEVAGTLIYPEMKKRLDVHRMHGDLCIMATASPGFYADAIAVRLGFDDVLSTSIEIGERVPFFPSMPGGNNKGERKVERLRAMKLLSEDCVDEEDVFAYSDSSADLPMLLAAKWKILVNPSPRLCSRLGGERVKVLEFPLPWRGKAEKMWKFAVEMFGLR